MDKHFSNSQTLSGYNHFASSPQTNEDSQMKLAHCYERGGIVYVKGTISGKRYRLSTGKRASKRMLEYINRNWESEIQSILLNKQEVALKISEQALIEKGQITFKDFCKKLMPIWESTLKPSSFLNRKKVLSGLLYPKFGDAPMSAIEYTAIRDWLYNFETRKGERLSSSYFRQIACLLNQIFAEAKKEGIITDNPISELKKPKQTTKNEPQAPFSHDEIAKILRCNDSMICDYAALAFFTGMRTGELLALQWDCIDFDNDTIAVERNAANGGLTTPKTGKRTIDMLPCVKEKLLEMQARSSSKWVFPNPKNTYFSHSSIRGRWQRALKKLGIEYRSIYHTRHTFATTMISAGENILWVSATLGHANTQMTFSRYAKYVPKTRGRHSSIVEQQIATLLAQNENIKAG